MTVTNPSEQPRRSSDGMTMDDMTPAHAKPARRDLLWVLVLILACGLLEVWASWLSIGAVSGFPKLGRMTTGWILPVTTEAYWSAALFAWLAVPAGPKSAAFAKWSAAAMFVLSLAGQESDHLLAAAGRTVPPVFVVGFVTALPLISVALIAILIHLRQTDRDDAAAAERKRTADERAAAAEAVAADERTVLRTELDTLAAEVEPLREALAKAEAGREAEVAKVAELTQKLARISGRKPTRKSPPKKRPVSTPETTVSSPTEAEVISTPETQVPEDLDTQAAALEILAREPQISGSELGRRLGRTERYGCMLKKSLAASVQDGG